MIGLAAREQRDYGGSVTGRVASAELVGPRP
jgi:hypothetical protein